MKTRADGSGRMARRRGALGEGAVYQGAAGARAPEINAHRPSGLIGPSKMVFSNRRGLAEGQDVGGVRVFEAGPAQLPLRRGVEHQPALEGLCSGGVTCRGMSGQKGGFLRYSLPPIRPLHRSAGHQRSSSTTSTCSTSSIRPQRATHQADGIVLAYGGVRFPP